MRTEALPSSPIEVRSLIRSGEWTGPTAGLAPGYVQANLVLLPSELAFDFLLFCQRNPKPCPVIEVLEAGQFEPVRVARGANLLTDVPKYRVFKNGEMVREQECPIKGREDLVSFLLGCSFTFENALVNAGIRIRHLEQGTNVPMYVTNIETTPEGHFSGPMVVSMRPIKQHHVVRAVQVTSRLPLVHGAPVHIGDPEAIGIGDITRPDYGDHTAIEKGEVPVFWACGVTPQAVAVNSKPSLMITHSPGHMFVTDWRDEDLATL